MLNHKKGNENTQVFPEGEIIVTTTNNIVKKNSNIVILIISNNTNFRLVIKVISLS